MTVGHRTLRAPRGNVLTTKGWAQEAALRMLHNNLDPDVAERPDDLVVYGGTGKAARNWEALEIILRELRELENDETLLIQSGKAVGKFRTHEDAPRVLLANSNLVGRFANWEEFRRLEGLGLIMYGQMTAGSWIYIGSQGIVQGTYETFVAARKAYAERTGKREGLWALTAGLGGMGGAQPLAAVMAGVGCLGIEIDPERIEKRLKTGYVDARIDDLDEALRYLREHLAKGVAKSVAVCGNAAELFPEIARRGLRPDLVTDQTAAHDPLVGYIPSGLSLGAAEALRKSDPKGYVERAKASMRVQVEAMLAMKEQGAEVFDYGNNIRTCAEEAGCARAFDIPGFVPAYIRDLFCQGKGPFRWVALSGDPEDIRKTDEAVLEAVDDPDLHRWIRLAQERIQFQGLPARICWLGYGDRKKVGLVFNDLVKKGIVRAPIVIGRDHLDCGSVASPFRETEGMKDGSDAIADWAILNALANVAGGASWVSFHHGGGVGIGNSLHAGMVIVADGTDQARRRLERVLTIDPGMGIIRHADAGYETANRVADEKGVHVPHRSAR